MYTFRFRANDGHSLEVDFGAVDFSSPRLALSSSIGKGLSFTSKFLTSKLNGTSTSAQPLVNYLLSLNHQGDVSRFQIISYRNKYQMVLEANIFY